MIFNQNFSSDNLKCLCDEPDVLEQTSTVEKNTELARDKMEKYQDDQELFLNSLFPSLSKDFAQYNHRSFKVKCQCVIFYLEEAKAEADILKQE